MSGTLAPSIHLTVASARVPKEVDHFTGFSVIFLTYATKLPSNQPASGVSIAGVESMLSSLWIRTSN